jgi:hypothetical protein
MKRGRRKDTYTANLNAQRKVTVDSHGNVRLQATLLDGDPGRPIEVPMSAADLELMAREGREALQQLAIERARAEQRQRAWDLQLRVFELQHQKEQLQQVVEQVRQAVQPVDSPSGDSTERRDGSVAPPLRPH